MAESAESSHCVKEILKRRLVPASEPSILKRKRKQHSTAVMTSSENEDVYADRRSEKRGGRQPHGSYVSRLAEKYAPDAMITIRNCSEDSMSDNVIEERLRLRKVDYDPESITCGVSMCGRQFTSLQVLAWHLSYSHMDLNATSSTASLCYLCGNELTNAKVS